MIINTFCTVGAHSVTITVDGKPGDVVRLPIGWRKVRASVIPFPKGPDDDWSPGIWYADPNATAEVFCCPDHDVVHIDSNKEEGTS